jgi:predicted transcriptional regulator of viral defense system
MAKKTDIFEIINENGVMRAKELSPYVASGAQLRRYAEDGRLISLGAGYYADPSLDPLTAVLAVVARYYPHAVISNITALFVHGLTDERIDQIDVDIPRESSIRNKLIRTHRVNPKLIKGVEEATYNGIRLKVYSKERALCDAYHVDPGGPIFLKAFKRYAKFGAVDADAIATFDKLLKTNVLRSAMQELADG